MGESGHPLNVWKTELKDLLDNKKIRFIHHLATEPTYCYFVQNEKQAERFQMERELGSPAPYRRYHIYLDEKLDKVSESMDVQSSR